MVKDLAMKPFQSSFLSCEKDTEIILRKLFVESRPYSDDLKRLLIINTKDCLDDKTNPVYLKAINEMTLPKLFEKGCLNIKPKIILGEFEEVKSYILITSDNFSVNKTNPQFRDCTVYIDVITHLDYWDLGNYRMRPLKIVGYIDGILDNSRLTGIGTFQFESCVMSKYDEDFSGYTLKYRAIHGSDDELLESDKIV